MSDNFDHSYGGHDATPLSAGPDAHPTADLFSDAWHPAGSLGGAAVDYVHGSPTSSSQEWFLQAGDGYCLPASLTEVVSEVTGHPLPDESLVTERLAELGMPPSENGLPLEAGEKLLDSLGIESHIQHNATMGELENYLDQGRSIILGVNADVIWDGHNDPISNPANTANHALLITAIDESRGVVVLSDPGTPNGNQETVQLSVFEQAWAAGDNQLLVTDQPTHNADGVEIPGPIVMPMIVNGGALTPMAPSPSLTPATPQTYTVQAGDTLWDIAERFFGDGGQATRIAELSGITNPHLIHPGQTLTLPTN